MCSRGLLEQIIRERYEERKEVRGVGGGARCLGGDEKENEEYEAKSDRQMK